MIKIGLKPFCFPGAEFCFKRPAFFKIQPVIDIFVSEYENAAVH
jgi:hypothetical protein